MSYMLLERSQEISPPIVGRFTLCTAQRGVMAWFTLTNTVEVRGAPIGRQCSSTCSGHTGDQEQIGSECALTRNEVCDLTSPSFMSTATTLLCVDVHVMFFWRSNPRPLSPMVAVNP